MVGRGFECSLCEGRWEHCPECWGTSIRPECQRCREPSGYGREFCEECSRELARREELAGRKDVA